MHHHTACGQLALELAWGQWAVEILQSMQALGNGTPAMHCHTASGQWAVELLQ